MGVPISTFAVEPSGIHSSASLFCRAEEWIPLGSTAKVEIGTPTLFKAKIERQTGWIVNEIELSIYVLTDDGREYVAMSNTCTHLGCRVRWIADQNQFFFHTYALLIAAILS